MEIFHKKEKLRLQVPTGCNAKTLQWPRRERKKKILWLKECGVKRKGKNAEQKTGTGEEKESQVRINMRRKFATKRRATRRGNPCKLGGLGVESVASRG